MGRFGSLSFPLWWFSMPAILKDWVERVFSCGSGYGVGGYNETHCRGCNGERTSGGKRAMLIYARRRLGKVIMVREI